MTLKPKHKTWAKVALLGLGAGLVVGMLSSRDTVPSITKKVPVPSEHVPDIKGADEVHRYLTAAGESANIGNGFVEIGMAASRRESGFHNKAVNDSPGEAEAACRGWKKTKDTLYKDNPFGAPGFCWGSGGWYGFLPSTGMKPIPFRKLDPRIHIFDPASSTAMFADYVHRIIAHQFPKLPPEHRNWLSIRRSMASLKTMFDYEEKGDRARASRERLAADLTANGQDPNWMYQTPVLGPYPGSGAVWEDLKQLTATA